MGVWLWMRITIEGTVRQAGAHRTHAAGYASLCGCARCPHVAAASCVPKPPRVWLANLHALAAALPLAQVWAAGVMLYLLLSGRYPFWDCKREDIKPGMKPYEVSAAGWRRGAACREWRLGAAEVSGRTLAG